MDNIQFFTAILKTDTEEVSRMLKECPELAVQGISKRDVGNISQRLNNYGGYDASDGFRYRPGYIAEGAPEGRWYGDDIRLGFCYRDTPVTRKEKMLPIQLCWAPSHKGIVKLLLNCGAGINDRQEDQDKRSCDTLLCNTMQRLHSTGPNICADGLREYAEYIKWLIEQGASMSVPVRLQLYCQSDPDRPIWGTLYDEFYECLGRYVLTAAGKYSDPVQGERVSQHIDIMADLSRFLFNDITRDEYIQYGAFGADDSFLRISSLKQETGCALYIVGSVLSNPGILSSLESLSQEKRNTGKVRMPDELVSRLLDIALYPAEQVLKLFSHDELLYICQKEDWYRKLTCNIMKRCESINGWKALWDILNRYVPVNEVKGGLLPVTDCLKAYQKAYQIIPLEDDVPGKIEAYERALGEDMALNARDGRMIWPVLAYTAVYLYEDYAGNKPPAPDMPERTRDVIETLCGVANKYGGSINEKNPLTGQTSAHILCRYMAEVYKELKLGGKDKDILRAQTLRAVTEYLSIFRRYGADLSVKDEEGRTPIEAFPKSLASAMTKCLAQMDYERSAAIEDVDMFVR